ncbi:MAG: hypothetical protein M5U28_40325 [Sandaracinaceae bacterium]|nr:hypothetical protein [Sandaracinaceae bacterium]
MPTGTKPVAVQLWARVGVMAFSTASSGCSKPQPPVPTFATHATSLAKSTGSGPPKAV